MKYDDSQIYEKDAEKRYVFRLDLKAHKVLDDITSNGRLFHVFAAAHITSDGLDPPGLQKEVRTSKSDMDFNNKKRSGSVGSDLG